MNDHAIASPAAEESKPVEQTPPAPPPLCPTCGGPMFRLRVADDPPEMEGELRCRCCRQASPTEQRIMALLRQILERLPAARD
jgi:uncharacterized protein YbaR (Trm112 family)